MYSCTAASWAPTIGPPRACLAAPLLCRLPDWCFCGSIAGNSEVGSDLPGLLLEACFWVCCHNLVWTRAVTQGPEGFAKAPSCGDFCSRQGCLPPCAVCESRCWVREEADVERPCWRHSGRGSGHGGRG